MNKNYYDILEINKNASPEIVKKAYITLAKKYHPDLQENEQKKDSEEKLKLINEAYEVLSDEEKRKQYDAELLNNEPNTNELINENINLKNELNKLKQTPKNDFNGEIFDTENKTNNYNQELEYQKRLEYQQNLERARQKAYHDAYIQELKNRGYKIRYKKTFKDYVKNFIALILTILILFLLCHIPPIKNFLINIYNQNPIIHFLVDFILNIFNK